MAVHICARRQRPLFTHERYPASKASELERACWAGGARENVRSGAPRRHLTGCRIARKADTDRVVATSAMGDSVLGVVVTDTLFRTYPDLAEAVLAKRRAAVVNMHVLADIARGLQLGRYLKLGRDEEERGGRHEPTILADSLEAVIGAVYLDGGLIVASQLTHRLFDPLIDAGLASQQTTAESNRVLAQAATARIGRRNSAAG
jgi:Ribonuclease-III-like